MPELGERSRILFRRRTTFTFLRCTFDSSRSVLKKLRFGSPKIDWPSFAGAKNCLMPSFKTKPAGL